MILKSLIKKRGKQITNQSRYNMAFFDKVSLLVRSMLNKMSNEDNRSFDQTYAQNQLESVEKPFLQQTPQEVEKKYIETNKLLANLERGRLHKIDEVLDSISRF